MFLGRVSETFDITGRGVVVAFGTTYEQLPQDVKLKIGDQVEFRTDGVVVLQSRVAGIEHCSPWTPKSIFAFLLPRTVKKQDVPIGADVWAVE